MIVARYLEFFPEADLPDPNRRAPQHGLRALVCPRLRPSRRDKRLLALVEERARVYFGADADVPAGWEPGGADFFSPSLIEADLMRRVLPPAEFRSGSSGSCRGPRGASRKLCSRPRR